ncbi:MAG: hypothetical protein PHC92_08350 [Syntrophomonadaceae bacterium]|nr:hypothetical protein [Syntrophomonadaceae bacterium]MDD3022308.1 hypothetical protein [Syntrophomonadaceae bacterium]
MTSKLFFCLGICISAALLLAFVLFNYVRNDYGLFGNCNEPLKIYGKQERLPKYLFSYRYIPENFEGIIVGPSLSDNLDPSLIEEYKIYNASIYGGNATELRLIVENALEHNGRLKFLILCLDPYFTKDCGKKTSHIDPREYRGSLGSVDTIRLYINQVMVKTGFTPDYYNEYGCFDFTLGKANSDARSYIKDAAQKPSSRQKIEINPGAFDDIGQIVTLAHQKELQVFAFYFPRPHELYLLRQEHYLDYQNKMNSLFSPGDLVWDFNSEEYRNFSDNYRNYSDEAHLSKQGATVLLREIKKKLESAQS